MDARNRHRFRSKERRNEKCRHGPAGPALSGEYTELATSRFIFRKRLLISRAMFMTIITNA